MNEENEYRVKHLEFIEDIINRQAQNSFTIRGWSITLSAGIFTYLLTQDTATKVQPASYFIVILPALVFWLLDAFYLGQERLYRCLYEDIRLDIANTGTHRRELFDMNTERYKENKPYRKAIIGRTVWTIPFMIFAVSLILYLISQNQ